MRRLAPLEQRLHVDFDPSGQFDSTRAVQVRLSAFDHARLVAVGKHRRPLPDEAPGTDRGQGVQRHHDALARGVTGELGGKVGIAPRLFLKKLISLLDQVEEHVTFDPAVHWQLTIASGDMTADERDAAGLERTVDDIVLDLEGGSGGGGGGLPPEGGGQAEG